jgi:hypothetical protein
VDPRAWLRPGSLVIVDGAAGAIGANTCGLLCGVRLNLLSLAIAAQGTLPPTARVPVLLLVDEFAAIPGADYETILTQLAKFGGSLTLATQSLAQLDALDHGGRRALRAAVFASVDGLFVFNVSADDARCLVPELGGPAVAAEEDLGARDDFEGYARLSIGRTRQPPFPLP